MELMIILMLLKIEGEYAPSGTGTVNLLVQWAAAMQALLASHLPVT
jgi:hypothetical protein